MQSGKRVLIAVSDPNARMRFTGHFAQEGWDVRSTSDAHEALWMLYEYPTDVLLSQIPLRNYDAFELLERIARVSMFVSPGVVMLLHPGYWRFEGRLRSLGAANCVSNHAPLQEIEAACANITVEDRLYASSTRENAIRTLLAQLNFSPAHRGTQYLETAIRYTLCDGRLLRDFAHRLYPIIAQKFGVNAGQVERGIRHAIENAWSGGSVDVQYKLFENTIDEKRGKPTNGAMIARATEALRAKEATYENQKGGSGRY